MSPKSLFLLALTVAVCVVTGPRTYSQDNSVALSVSVSVADKGNTGTLSVSLGPPKGLHIKTTPAPEFSADTTSPIKVTSKMRFRAAKNGLLDTKKPLEIDFSIPREIPAGTYPLKGTLRWFLCSDKEGWCRMDRKDISVNVVVAR